MYGIVIDKATQTLTVYKNGERIGSCAVSTGLPTVKYLHRETPAGEFITVTRRGTIENSGGYSKYTVRISGNYHLCEIPTTKKNGKDYSLMADKLGQKASRGNICLAHDEFLRRRHQRRMDLGFDRQQQEDQSASSSTTRIVLPSRRTASNHFYKKTTKGAILGAPFVVAFAIYIRRSA